MTPVAVFAYNRPVHLGQLLESLSRCGRQDECAVTIYCDGPKNEGVAVAVAETRRVARAWADAHNAEVVERDRNLGLARSIITGVSNLCERYGRVIVVEDDFVLAPDFLDYMLQALDRYADAENVYQVSGYMFHVEHPERPDCLFLPLTTTWGWGTWQRAWRVFDWNMTGAVERLADPRVRHRFNLGGVYPYHSMVEWGASGKVDSWGIRWWWSVFNAEGLVLFPRRSLVWVGGFDDSGTHCKDEVPDHFRQDPVEAFAVPRIGGSLIWPDRVEADMAAFGRVVRLLKAGGLMDSLIVRVWKRLRAVFKVSGTVWG